MEEVAKISLLVYALFMAIGGIFGFVKGKSKASLIAGVLSGILLVGCYLFSSTDRKNAFLLGVGITSTLTIVFAIRIAKTKKIMPAGALLLLTIAEEMILLVAAFVKF